MFVHHIRKSTFVRVRTTPHIVHIAYATMDLLNGEVVVITIELEPACYSRLVRMVGACSTEPVAAYTIGHHAWTRCTLSNLFRTSIRWPWQAPSISADRNQGDLHHFPLSITITNLCRAGFRRHKLRRLDGPTCYSGGARYNQSRSRMVVEEPFRLKARLSYKMPGLFSSFPCGAAARTQMPDAP